MRADNCVTTDRHPIKHRNSRSQPGVISNHDTATNIHRLLD
jgi:hypothetical protein